MITKLSDLYIPLSEFMESVKQIEKFPEYTISVKTTYGVEKGEEPQIADNILYTVPYPYQKAAIETMPFSKSDLEDMDSAVNKVKAKVDERVIPIIKNAIPYEVIRTIDSNPELFCMVNRINGVVFVTDKNECALGESYLIYAPTKFPYIMHNLMTLTEIAPGELKQLEHKTGMTKTELIRSMFEDDFITILCIPAANESGITKAIILNAGDDTGATTNITLNSCMISGANILEAIEQGINIIVI